MTEELASQPERLSYTRRDIELIDQEVDQFITYFIPRIRNVGRANIGRLFLRVLEALVDKLNYSVDARFRESILRTVSELQNAIDITEIVRYKPAGVSSSTTDLTATTLSGPAPAGGIAIPQYSIFATESSPVKQFISLEAYTLPEGATELEGIAVVQGVRVVNQTILVSANGDPSESVRFPVAKTPHDYIQIFVDGDSYEVVADFRESEPIDKHCVLSTNEDRFTTVTFGDGTYGVKLTSGAVVSATYLQSLGEEGNSPSGSIKKVVGSLGSSISVTNSNASTGGFDGDEVEDVVRKAPLQAKSFYLATRTEDFSSIAEEVSGVYRALADAGDGPLVNLYILPTGGGTASSTILSAVESLLETRIIHGSILVVNSILTAGILVSMDVVLKESNISKTTARSRIYEAISAFKLNGDPNPDGALYFRNLRIGRGFTFSDMSSLLEGIDDGNLVDYVDYNVFTRYPTPIAGNDTTSVEFVGEVVPLSEADYDEWSVQYLSSTTFAVFKNSVKDSEGTIGVQHTSSDGSIKFTLGESGDTLVPDDQWTFRTSAYRNNMRLSKYEVMELVRDSDLTIRVYYPGEKEIGE